MITALLLLVSTAVWADDPPPYSNSFIADPQADAEESADPPPKTKPTQPPAPAPGGPLKTQILVWNETRTRREAVRSLDSMKILRKLTERGIRFQTGFPRIQEGGEVPGMTPGRWLVILGFCDPASPQLVEFIQAMRPGARAKPVPIRLGTDLCPEVFPETPKYLRVEKRLPKGRIGAIDVRTDSSSEPGVFASKYALVLNSASTGDPIEVAELKGPSKERAGESMGVTEFRECGARITPTATGLYLRRECVDHRTICSGGEVAINRRYIDEHRVILNKKGRIEITGDRQVLKRSACIGATLPMGQ